MRTRIPAMLMICLPLGLAPMTALAASCGDYPLTAEQQSYLSAQSLDNAIPEGEVPLIQRCDVDGNNVINNDDLKIIRAHRGLAPTHPDDPMDWDGNGVIHGRDVGGCASACNSVGSNGCAVQEEAEEDGLQAAQEAGGTALQGDPAACYQVEDLDGDGAQDLVGMFEYTGVDTRGGDWSLEVVILTEDVNGNVQHITFPYTGQVSNGDLAQHLSLQRPGVVDLHPGSITINGPGVVSYRNGEPEVIYYYDENGALAQAFYGIVD